MHLIKALQSVGYKVTVASDHFSPEEAESKLGMGEVLSNCKHFLLPRFKPRFPRFLAYQRLSHTAKQMKMLESLKPDVAFNTQSPTLYVRNAPNFSMIYDLSEFFALHTSGQFRTNALVSTSRLPYESLLKRKMSPFSDSRHFSRTFIPLSYLLEYQLKLFGYTHTPAVFPPCDLIFKPREKKSRVIQVTRVFPNKRLEEFIEIARQLEKVDFMIVAADTATERLTNSDYLRTLLSKKPGNLEFVEARIRQRPELLEESKVYLYTSIEPGINISLAQALGAGCFPITPVWGGGAELVQAAGAGYTYSNVDEAVEKVERAISAATNPSKLSEKAKIFGADHFEESIKALVTSN